MRLFEIYQEDSSSTFTHDGKSYDLNKLFELSDHLKIEQYRVSDMTWILKYDLIEPGSYDHININIPVLITEWYDEEIDGWRHAVIDGIHRLYVAMQGKASHIPGKMIPTEMLEQCLIS